MLDSVELGEFIVRCGSLAFKREPVLSAWQLSESATLPQVPSELAQDGIWLDVDLDAFCNRFDGDSDKASDPSSDEELKIMRSRIRDFVAELSNAPWLPYVEAVSVAASPGFFPSEHWEFTVPEVCEGIARVLTP